MCEQLGDNKTFEPEIAAARTGRDPICSGARPERRQAASIYCTVLRHLL